MAENVFGIGIIGAGFMGKTHTYNYITMPLFYDDLPFKIKLIAICDSDLSRAVKHKEDFGFEFATDNYLDLTQRKDIDIIDVCTPTIFHYEQIINAIRSEKHIYIDKPLCATIEEAETIVEITDKTNQTIQIAYHYRYFPAILKVKILINEGFLGKPITYRFTYYHSSNLDPKKPMGWKQDKTMGGGGVLLEMACHVLDMIYHFLGDFESIDMESIILYYKRPREDGKLVKVEAEDHVLLNIKMKNGMIGTAEVSKVVVGTNDDFNFEIYGTEGAIKYKMMNPNFLWVYSTRDNTGLLGGNRGYKAIETVNKYPESKSQFPGPRFGIGWIRGHVACQHNFLKCIHTCTKATPSIRESLYIQKIINRIYQGEKQMSDIT